MSSVTETQAATLNKFIKGWAEWTPESMLETWSQDCTQKNLPFSSNVPIKSRADAEKLFPILMSFMTDFELKVHNIVHDPAQRKAAIYALTTANTPAGPYSNEHAMFVWFDESGEKINKLEEMFDSVVMRDILPKLEQYKAEKQAKAASH
ncbi:hypothetical protein N8I77_007189 [Diaporthe amygdali]|uniref:SnoaL-like domain-containing protein n=1 Tax=Phomopsis amygdali TaxID=1214568 RepID=A0AAD9SCI5_PHOAM|nr:uncharacterized protein J7T55_007814 [Diaporthe amygdali]KAJ0107623.1 hypothetical protein J7T55_007814 [Diaporthe amygdali]KAK2604245.1 hypothetical protein N8I77_007189 [Diaporthe amygdali]